MFGCLVVLLLELVVGVIVTAVSGSLFLGLVSSFAVVVATMTCWLRVAGRRYARLMTAWGLQNGLRDVTFRPTRGSINPPEMPWWMGWAAYDLWGVNGRGERQHFHIFITGAGGCLFQLQISVTTDSDYITLSAADFDGRPLSEVSAAEVLRVMEQKQKPRSRANTNSPEELVDETSWDHPARRHPDDPEPGN